MSLNRNDFGSFESVVLVVKNVVPPTFNLIHSSRREILLTEFCVTSFSEFVFEGLDGFISAAIFVDLVRHDSIWQPKDFGERTVIQYQFQNYIESGENTLTHD